MASFQNLYMTMSIILQQICGDLATFLFVSCLNVSNMTVSCSHLDAIVPKLFKKRPQSALSGWDRCLFLERKHGPIKLVLVAWQPQIILGRLSERHFWTIRVARRLFNWRSAQPTHGRFSRATLPARSLPRSPRPSIS